MAGKELCTLYEQYINESEYSARLRPSTLKCYKEVFDLFQQIVPEVISTSDLNAQMCSEFFKRLQMRVRKVGKGDFRKGVKNSTIITYRNKLNPFLNWLRIRGEIANNPLSELPIPKLDTKEKKQLTDAEVRKLYSAITVKSKNSFLLRRDTLIISLLFFSGLRSNEVQALQVNDIDLEKQLLMVRKKIAKSGKERYIPLHPTLRMHIVDYLKERNSRKFTTPYLLASNNQDNGLTMYGLKHWVHTLSIKSGVKFHLHQFRHTFACNLAKRDVNAVKIQKLLGHSSLDMTMTYLHSISSQSLREDVNKLSF